LHCLHITTRTDASRAVTWSTTRSRDSWALRCQPGHHHPLVATHWARISLLILGQSPCRWGRVALRATSRVALHRGQRDCWVGVPQSRQGRGMGGIPLCPLVPVVRCPGPLVVSRQDHSCPTGTTSGSVLPRLHWWQLAGADQRQGRSMGWRKDQAVVVTTCLTGRSPRPRRAAQSQHHEGAPSAVGHLGAGAWRRRPACWGGTGPACPWLPRCRRR
jgi:hypothetical protein